MGWVDLAIFQIMLSDCAMSRYKQWIEDFTGLDFKQSKKLRVSKSQSRELMEISHFLLIGTVKLAFFASDRRPMNRFVGLSV